MPTLNVVNKTVELDDEGFLVDFDQWSPEVARGLAEREGIPELTDQHMRVLYVMREYYQKFKVAPMVHLLARECGNTYRELHNLFKKQPGKRAARLAGLPKASGCV